MADVTVGKDRKICVRISVGRALKYMSLVVGRQ